MKPNSLPKSINRSRRHFLSVGTITAFSPLWVTPIIRTVVLPVHAQTSAACVTDATVGGPLAGNASGAATCQAACEAEANIRNAQLCSVTETNPASGTECACELDLR